MSGNVLGLGYYLCDYYLRRVKYAFLSWGPCSYNLCLDTSVYRYSMRSSTFNPSGERWRYLRYPFPGKPVSSPIIVITGGHHLLGSVPIKSLLLCLPSWKSKPHSRIPSPTPSRSSCSPGCPQSQQASRSQAVLATRSDTGHGDVDTRSYTPTRRSRDEVELAFIESQ